MAIKQSEIKKKLEESIIEMHKISVDEEREDGKRIYAANALSGLVSRYKEMFGFQQDEVAPLKVHGKKISGYKGS